MQSRSIGESKLFLKSLNSYFQYKEKSMKDVLHAKFKYHAIINKVVEISKNPSPLSKKVNYRNSKNLNYFIFQKHHILFKLTSNHLQLMYFVASKRIKKIL